VKEDNVPKIKTHRGAAKRFKITGKGKIKRSRAYKSHLLTGKPSKRTKRLRTSTLVSDSEYVKMRRLLPYL
jgi:large subunit ribosomal protein L35